VILYASRCEIRGNAVGHRVFERNHCLWRQYNDGSKHLVRNASEARKCAIHSMWTSQVRCFEYATNNPTWSKLRKLYKPILLSQRWCGFSNATISFGHEIPRIASTELQWLLQELFTYVKLSFLSISREQYHFTRMLLILFILTSAGSALPLQVEFSLLQNALINLPYVSLVCNCR
jgi:hypothetical protein